MCLYFKYPKTLNNVCANYFYFQLLVRDFKLILAPDWRLVHLCKLVELRRCAKLFEGEHYSRFKGIFQG